MAFSSSSRGFTLMELLVVVAIIGMLSSIIMTSVNSARNKGNDAAVKSNLRTIMTQAALYYDNTNSYGASFSANTCPTSGTTMFYADTVIRNAIAAAANAGGGTTRCATDGTNFAVSTRLKSSTDHWCVDSAGASRQTSNASWTGVACP